MRRADKTVSRSADDIIAAVKQTVSVEVTGQTASLPPSTTASLHHRGSTSTGAWKNQLWQRLQHSLLS